MVAITATNPNELIVFPEKSIMNPIANVIKKLRRHESTIMMLPVITHCLSNTFKRKYPGRNVVSSNEAIYLIQFINGIFAQSRIEPL
nr:hypothetical protein [Candidatus Baldrarchaeota archaeon]